MQVHEVESVVVVVSGGSGGRGIQWLRGCARHAAAFVASQRTSEQRLQVHECERERLTSREAR